MASFDRRVVLQKDPCSKHIVVEVIDPMPMTILGNNGMETIEQLHASINVAQVASRSFQGEDVFAMDVERVEARLGRPEDQYDQFEEEEND
jgi:hypothetical protein